MRTKPLIVGSIATLVAVSGGYPSVADDFQIGDGGIDGDGTAEIEIEVPAVLQDLVEETSSSSGIQYAAVPHLDFVDDASLQELGEEGPLHCMTTLWLPIPPGEDRDTVIAEHMVEHESHLLTAFYPSLNGDPNAPCPSDPLDALPQAVVQEAVRRAVVELVPRPDPSIPPGRALTGLPAYLVTDHELRFGPVSQTLDLGVASPTVTMSGTATTTVDWGDGTVTDHDIAGTPYPDGQVSHIYTDKGTVQVQVTDHWTVTYDVGPVSGTLEATLDPVTLEAFPVREFRAARESPDAR